VVEGEAQVGDGQYAESGGDVSGGVVEDEPTAGQVGGAGVKRAKKRRRTLSREIERTWRLVFEQASRMPADTVIYFRGEPVALVRLG
jgi:hypothetical protein